MKLKSFMYFYPEKPKLMHVDQLGILPPKQWVGELKYNGTRLQLHCNFTAGRLNCPYQFWNRHEQELDYTPTPEISDILHALPIDGYTLFDGELRHNKTIGVRNKIIIWDVFILNGELLVGMEFRERRKILEGMFKVNGEPVGITEQYHVGFKQVFESVISEDEIEGLVLKNVQGKLSLGRRSAVDSNWMFKVRKPSGRYKF